MSQFQDLVGRALYFWFPGEEIIENYRPPWLAGLELDFYLPNQKFGVEVQGRQHYLYVPQFHKSVKDYHAQRRRDGDKRKMCNAVGVRLVSISSCTGWYKKLRTAFPDRTFPLLPKTLQADIHKYRVQTHELREQQWVAIKVKSDGTQVPVNRTAANYLEQKRRNSTR